MRGSHLDFPVVGIGASAGGLKALVSFFEAVNPESGMAYVVVLHLSPTHESNLDKLLQAVTSMPVQQVLETTAIRRDHVYVIPPNKELSMVDGTLRVAPLGRKGVGHQAIDLFFRSLGQTHQSKAIAIVMSGTGSDGSVGIKTIKEQGGIALAQDPSDAEYGSMPRNAIGTELVDFVMPVTQIPHKLADLAQNAAAIELARHDELSPSEPDSSGAADAALREVLALLRVRTHHDFSEYKRATVLRRIERRLQVNQMRDLPTYRDFIRDHVSETRPLLKDMLISVTNFFRDRQAFAALESVVPELFRGKAASDQVRVWVAGCATGEEAYSLAILLAEFAQSTPSAPALQLFATDIDEEAVAFARAGLYPEAIATDVSATRLRRFFVKEAAGYRVQKFVREMVMFAPHNVISDPPFSRLDLVACRNLLIYLNGDAQSRVLDLIHFSLRPNGCLFLGSSESVDDASDLFQTIDKTHRLYRALPRSRPMTAIPAFAPAKTARADTAPLTDMTSFRRVAAYDKLHEAMLEHYAPPSVVTNDQWELVHVSPKAAEFLRIPAGVPSLNLLSVVRAELRLDLRAALYQARETGETVDSRRVVVTGDHASSTLDMVVHPVRDMATSRMFYLVIFGAAPVPGEHALVRKADEREAPYVTQLEAELQATKDQLRTSIEQYETQNEELKASNEELQAINEELRSATEELETSKEELQSINEELTTVNQELKNKIDETTSVNNDLQNLISSTDIAVVFVDRGMRLARFTPPARAVFNLIPTDVGRPLQDITHRLEHVRLEEDIQEVLHTLRPLEREVRTTTGSWYIMRTLPYRTVEDRIEGAILTLVEISTRKGFEEQLRRAEQRRRAVVESIRDYAIVTMDHTGVINGWNPGAAQIFGYLESEIIGRPTDLLFTIEDRDAGVPQREMQTAIDEGAASDERWHVRKDGSRFYASGMISPLNDGELFGFVKIARDETERQQATIDRDEQFRRAKADRDALESVGKVKDHFLATLSHELRNPLNLIMMQSEVLRRAEALKSEPKLRHAADVIHQMVDTQARLIDDLLDMSRLRMGKMTIEPQLLPLPFVVGDSIGALQRDVALKNVTLNVELATEPLIVQADPVRIKQIAWNLISNAVKFTPPLGKITVRVSREGDKARLDVEDTGEGIDPQTLPHIFEMFRQGESPATRAQGGIGIGLALVKQLVDLQGGRVEAVSQGRGKGTRFTVWLPLYVTSGPASPAETVPEVPAVPAVPRVITSADAAALGIDTPVAADRRLAGIRMLLAEDEKSTAEALRELLEMEGALVAVALRAAEAVELAGKNDYDVLMTDIAMPDMDGHALLRTIRGSARNADVPAIACTGFGSPIDIARAQKSGFAAHLTKPIAIEEVVNIVRTLSSSDRR